MIAPAARSPSFDVAITIAAGDWPEASEIEALALDALAAAEAVAAPEIVEGSEASLVFTDDEAIRRLNAEWRGKDGATNVLSFPQQPAGPVLGDIVMAAETMRREALLAEVPLDAHIAHLIVHGFLHLLGYDHENDDDAERMEDLERRALATIGVDDPYRHAPMDR